MSSYTMNEKDRRETTALIVAIDDYVEGSFMLRPSAPKEEGEAILRGIFALFGREVADFELGIVKKYEASNKDAGQLMTLAWLKLTADRLRWALGRTDPETGVVSE